MSKFKGRFVARCAGKVRYCRLLYECVGVAKALVMDAPGVGQTASVYDSEVQLVVAVWTDDANGPELHKLKTWPQDVADREWAELLKAY